MRKLIFTLLLLPLAVFGQSANDLILTQRKSDGSGNIQRNVTAGASSLLGFSSGVIPVKVTIGSGLSFNTLTNTLTGTGGGGDALVANPLSQFAATTSLQLTGVLSDETGSGAAVFAISPALTTPNLGTPSAATLTNATGLPIATGISGLGTGAATALAVNIGSSGAFVTNGGALGTPSGGTLTNATGLPISTGVSGLGTGVATLLATPSSANLAAAVTDETGTGAVVLATSPTLVTPTLGVATATSIATTRQAHGTVGATETFDRANGDTHTATLDENLTVTLTGWAPSGSLSSMLIGFTQDGTGTNTVTWPGAVVTAPTVTTTAGAVTWVSLWTTDGGTTVYASGTADGVPISSVSGLGTGVATALAVNVGSAGAPVVNGGALGTPSSGTLTNATGLPISTGVSGLGTGVATALAVNVGSSGAFVTNGGALGTPSSGTLTNATGLPQAGTVGLTTADSPQFTAVNVGHATDTTVARVGAGQISVEGVNVVTTSSTDTFTNKTFDAAATGNALKAKGYIYLTHPHLADGTGATISTTATSIAYGHATFSGTAASTANYVEYYLQVPEDIDTSVALRARLKVLIGADTAAQSFFLTSVSVADSAVPTSATLANSVTVAIAADATGANGDVETSAWTTLTSWAGALTAGQTWRIRLARDGSVDASTVANTELGLVIEYGITQ